MVLWGGDEVYELAHFRLVCCFVEELEQVDVELFTAEVGLEKLVNGSFKHEGIVDGDHPNLRQAVPAGLGTTRNGRVHDIIRDQEEGLQLQEG